MSHTFQETAHHLQLAPGTQPQGLQWAFSSFTQLGQMAQWPRKSFGKGLCKVVCMVFIVEGGDAAPWGPYCLSPLAIDSAAHPHLLSPLCHQTQPQGFSQPLGQVFAVPVM